MEAQHCLGTKNTHVPKITPHYHRHGSKGREHMCNSAPRSIHCLLWTTSDSEFNAQRCIQLKPKPRRRKTKPDLGMHLVCVFQQLHSAASTTKMICVNLSSRHGGTTTFLHFLSSINAQGSSPGPPRSNHTPSLLTSSNLHSSKVRYFSEIFCPFACGSSY